MDAFSDDLEVAVPEKPFEALVGDGKKFSDQDALAKALFHQNAHIARIQAENAELREKTASHKTIEEFLDQVKQSNANQQREYTSTPEEAATGGNEVDIEALVEAALAKRTAQSNFETNFKEANTALLEIYGQGAKQAVQDKANELGLTMDEMKQMAGKNKKVFLTLFKDAPQPAQQTFGDTPPRSQGRPATPVSDTARKSYWDRLFTSDRKAWEARSVERMNAAMKAGESFFDV